MSTLWRTDRRPAALILILWILAIAGSCAQPDDFEFSDPFYRPAELSPLLWVPAGAFVMGSEYSAQLDLIDDVTDKGFSDEWPKRWVDLDEFWIEQTEVSNAQYRACVHNGGCSDPDRIDLLAIDNYYLAIEYDDFPVLNVTQRQAADYCRWAKRRLPTEAQWEKAARGIDERDFPWGDRRPTCLMADFSQIRSERSPTGALLFYETCYGQTVPIDFYPSSASPYGALNMAGNAAEWVADWYDPDYYDSGLFPDNRLNPQGPDSGNKKVYRGGSFADNEYFIRTTFRGIAANNVALPHVGFRCAQ